MILRPAFLWMAAVLLFAPPLTYALGRLATIVSAVPPPVLLPICCTVACALILAVLALTMKRMKAQLRLYLPTSKQMIVIALFALGVTIPRLIAVDPAMPLAVYDDNWHYQKMVSIFSSFPDFSHYLFPDLRLSYYFYGYILPAAAYSIKTGINLKILWVVYLSVLILSLYTLILTCCNSLLPRSSSCRTLLALMITFLGGLHEWPVLIHAWVQGLPNWHTEWWAQGIGLDLQISSLYTACFWAPQHICGLALFSLVHVLLHIPQRLRTTYLVCGLLVGIQAGFSAYIALATFLYVLLCLVRPQAYSLRKRFIAALCFGAGCALALMPIVDCFVGRQGNIVFVSRFDRLPEYIFFLCAEFGILLILPLLYIVGKRNRTYLGASHFVDAAFIAGMLIILFCARSSGFNVISYRMLLPGQVLLAIYAVLQLERMKSPKSFLKILISVVLLIQLSGFFPEMIAMSKKHYDVRTGSVRLPEAVVAMNRSRPLDEVVAVPYMPAINTVWRLNTLINNLFRPKDVDTRFFCEGTVDSNNLVYLNSADAAALRRACTTGGAAAAVPSGDEYGSAAHTEDY